MVGNYIMVIFWNMTSIPEGFVSETYSNVFCGEPNSIIINQPTLVINKQKAFLNVSKTKGCYDIYVSMIDIPPESKKSEKWKVYAAGSVSIIVIICTVLVCYCRKSYLSSNQKTHKSINLIGFVNLMNIYNSMNNI